jgi:very-short-patch-repair endonuclease
LLAAQQHGVVARWQLVALGMSRTQIQNRVAAGWLHRVYRGVYAPGHTRLTLRGRWMAAVLACGPDAVLSHRPAAALWELRPLPSGPIDVTVPGRTRKGQQGIRVHNVRRLHANDREVVDGIPVTSVHRALLDYAEIARRQQLRLAVEAGERQDLLDQRKLDELYERSRGRRGRRVLRAAVAEMVGPAPWTQSELERRFLALIREHGFPEPQANALVEGYPDPVDLWWPQQRLVVEIDSVTWHKSRGRFEGDRLKDTKLQLLNCRVLRVTQRRMDPDPTELLQDLSRAFSTAPAAVRRAFGAGAASGP